MDKHELASVIGAVLLLFVVSGIGFVINGESGLLVGAFIFSFLIIFVHVFVKKGVAYLLDSSVEHKIWGLYRYGFKPKQHFKKELPFGLIAPLVLSLLGVLSNVSLMVMTFLTYETRALKHRAAKRFGFYSYTEMTDWHNGLIGSAGIVALLLVSFIGYFSGFEYLSKIAAYYAFWNLIPFSNLDGTQIFFGSRIIWTALAFISLIFVGYALFLRNNGKMVVVPIHRPNIASDSNNWSK